jgi:hypothetical protein
MLENRASLSRNQPLGTEDAVGDALQGGGLTASVFSTGFAIYDA